MQTNEVDPSQCKRLKAIGSTVAFVQKRLSTKEATGQHGYNKDLAQEKPREIKIMIIALWAG